MSAFQTLRIACDSIGMRRGEMTVDRTMFSALWHDAPFEMRQSGNSHTQTWLPRLMTSFVRSEVVSPEYAAGTRVSVDARVRIPLALGGHLVVCMEEALAKEGK